ncbi:hypothetical protein BDF20DRAFT_527915 [Mycotypha africana]|uniref:uncharacterized protein n=1 Tax=Mycotypha africana TaxID=64632 RepID=UPI002301325C|nr:uncharacterized protein BDF20DRAFT_527915 [Mycotypha africana]KAI8979732.1 hypothetical protein BDF20DRAFT_527915 [Mycotypha africana]
MYSLVPTMCRMAGATFLSMSLITSNFYSLIAGLVFLDAEMPTLYPIAYILVIIGVTIYTLAPLPTTSSPSTATDATTSHHHKNDEEGFPIMHGSSSSSFSSSSSVGHAYQSL